MSVFLSLVGQQPSAVALAYKTWRARFDKPNWVLLVTTEAMREVTGRLEAYFQSTGCRLEVLTIERTDVGGRPRWLRVVSDKVAGQTVIFAADGGLKFQMVQLAQHLPGKVTFLHSDARFLYVIRETGRVKKPESLLQADLGLDALLGLYGMKRRTGGRAPRIPGFRGKLPKGAEAGVVLQNVAGGALTPFFAWAWERAGQMYAIVRLDQDWGESQVLRQKARDILLLGSGRQTGGLRLRLAVVIRQTASLNRLRDAGIWAADTVGGLADWISGTRMPGSSQGHLLQNAPQSSVSRNPSRLDRTTGGGGTGEPIVVCLGTDPTATLLALTTHQPRTCYMLYDQYTEAVVLAGQRLLANAGRLPVGTILPVPTDNIGRGIPEALAEPIRSEGLKAANITPGTKAQGRALARCPGLRIWSIRTRDPACVCLSDDRPELPLTRPDLNTQTVVLGGRLLGSFERPSAQRDALRCAAGILIAHMQETGKPVGLLEGRLRLESSHGVLKLGHDGSFHATCGSETWHGTFRRRRGGFWLEDLVGRALEDAGAFEVGVGVRWAWPQGAEPRERLGDHRDELDIIASFDFGLVAISCKTGVVGVGRKEMHAWLREIESMTIRLLGRLALPVLAIPRRPASWIDLPRGAWLVDLEMLFREDFAKRLGQQFCARSTLHAEE